MTEDLVSSLEVIILAAGQGRRMASDLPKVLHPLAGRPLLRHVLATAATLHPQRIHIVYGHGAEHVRAACIDVEAHWVLQTERRGTGHAVAQALPAVAEDAQVLVLLGDVPLLRHATAEALCGLADQGLALLTFFTDETNAYGRIVRNAEGRVERIVEWRDASPAERALREVNSGILATSARHLRAWLPRLTDQNAQGELYLTDVVALARHDNCPIVTTHPTSLLEVQGVNSRRDLALLERAFQEEQAFHFMDQGVHVMDPRRFDVRGTLRVGRDVSIDVNCVFEGDNELGEGVSVGPGCVIRNTTVGRHARIEAHSVIDGAHIGDETVVGPLARLRPGTILGARVRVGNFVEVKASVVGDDSKINHLSYVGDARIGRSVNIGAGVITCNYDGARKHQTVIGDYVFVGSDCQLIAPVEIGAGATIGAGSTIAKDAPADQLTLSRTTQKTVSGWRRPTK